MSLCRRTLFMSSFLLLQYCSACLARLGWFATREINVCTSEVLWNSVCRIYSKQHVAFSPNVSLEFKWCNNTVLLTQLHLRLDFLMLINLLNCFTNVCVEIAQVSIMVILWSFINNKWIDAQRSVAHEWSGDFFSFFFFLFFKFFSNIREWSLRDTSI